MTEAWIGVIGALLGTLVGAGIAALVGLREQQRAPKLLLLEKRVEIYGILYGKLYAIADCLHRHAPQDETLFCINEYKGALISSLLYLDKPSKEKLIAVHNFLMNSIDEKGIDSKRYFDLMNESINPLSKGIGLEYKPA